MQTEFIVNGIKGTDSDMFDFQKHPKNYNIIERGFRMRIGCEIYWLLRIEKII